MPFIIVRSFAGENEIAPRELAYNCHRVINKFVILTDCLYLNQVTFVGDTNSPELWDVHMFVCTRKNIDNYMYNKILLLNSKDPFCTNNYTISNSKYLFIEN